MPQNREVQELLEQFNKDFDSYFSKKHPQTSDNLKSRIKYIAEKALKIGKTK